MAPLPPPKHQTVLAIYQAYKDANESRDGVTIPVSALAEECQRKQFYDFRWVSPQEDLDGRTLRIFETGNVEEDRMVENLRMIGCEVWDVDPDTGRQFVVKACGGHVKGKLDAEVLGLPEAPKTIHVAEIKSHNAKSFAKLLKEGVKAAKPLHFGQLQTYMYLRGRDRGMYLSVCKDTDELYAERLELDVEYVIRLLARAQRTIDASEPPPKLHEDPEHKMAFACGWCRHKPVCHGHKMPRVNCRTCLYSTPEPDGTWSCGKWSKPLSLTEQQEGCGSHLLLPGLVDGEQVDFSEEDESITYRMRDGSVWVDGAGVAA